MTTPAPPILPPAPRSRGRAELLLDEAAANGIDYVEVLASDHTRLTVGFLRDLPAGSNPWQLHAHPDLVTISGGEKVRRINVVSINVTGPRTLGVVVDVPGDWSTYELTIDVADLDPVLCRIAFSFMATCPSDDDCAECCPPQNWEEPEPRIDSLAKDFASFRAMLLDLEAQRHPSMSDRHIADLAITLLEVLAYTGDELSYAQDSAAAEAYLDTARRRVSVRRHTRLVDYVLGEGRNAMTPVHVAVTTAVPVPTGSRLLTQLAGPLPGMAAVAGPALDATVLTDDVIRRAPVLTGGRIFETAYHLDADPRHNVLHLHHWGEPTFWLDAGATTGWLWSEPPGGATTAVAPALQVGDRVVFEEVRSPVTGLAADADPAQRWMVRVTAVTAGADPAYQAQLDLAPDVAPTLLERTAAAQPALPLLGIRWSRADAPTRPLCVRAISPEGDDFRDVSLARGNIVLADHGVTLGSTLPAPPAQDAGGPGAASLLPPLRLEVADAPLTFQIGPIGEERLDLTGGAETAVPALQVTSTASDGTEEIYLPALDLFDSGPNDRSVVVEVNDVGQATVRFGDGILGQSPADAVSFALTYRVGNGSTGKIGAEALAHLAIGAASVSSIALIRNPLSATLGTDPETEEHARRIAPDAWKVRQERAVTAEDAVAAALTVPGVRAAVAALRWTGSWYTWLVSVLPIDPDDLVDDGGSHEVLSTALSAAVEAAMDHVRLAGQDVDIRPPEFVAVDLGLHVCAAVGQSRSALRSIVRNALIGVQPDGTLGLLAAPTLIFGRPLELGDVYATVAAIPGVDSVKATRLQRYGLPANGELAAGEMRVAPWQVLRLDADPSLPGRGVLEIAVDGGTP